MFFYRDAVIYALATHLAMLLAIRCYTQWPPRCLTAFACSTGIASLSGNVVSIMDVPKSDRLADVVRYAEIDTERQLNDNN